MVSMSERIRIAVLMGGPSQEHDISLSSGNGVTQALLAEGFSAEAVVIPRMLRRESEIEWTRRELLRANLYGVEVGLGGEGGRDAEEREREE